MIAGAAALALLLSVCLLCSRRIDTAVLVCALQSLCAAAAMSQSAVVVAAVALALNGVALPLALRSAAVAPEIAHRRHALPAWTAMLGVVAAVAWVSGGGAIGSGVVVTLLGLMLTMSRTHRLMRTLGLLSAQNGLLLVASLDPDLSLPAAFAVAVPLVPALVFADARLRP